MDARQPLGDERDFVIGTRREKAGEFVEVWAEWKSLRIELDLLSMDFVSIRQRPDIDSRDARIGVSVLAEIHERLCAEVGKS